jgi:hypothetical protein
LSAGRDLHVFHATRERTSPNLGTFRVQHGTAQVEVDADATVSALEEGSMARRQDRAEEQVGGCFFACGIGSEKLIDRPSKTLTGDDALSLLYRLQTVSNGTIGTFQAATSTYLQRPESPELFRHFIILHGMREIQASNFHSLVG